jgi:hypothetical protein
VIVTSGSLYVARQINKKLVDEDVFVVVAIFVVVAAV